VAEYKITKEKQHNTAETPFHSVATSTEPRVIETLSLGPQRYDPNKSDQALAL
jgi:hypothetical protein